MLYYNYSLPRHDHQTYYPFSANNSSTSYFWANLIIQYSWVSFTMAENNKLYKLIFLRGEVCAVIPFNQIYKTSNISIKFRQKSAPVLMWVRIVLVRQALLLHAAGHLWRRSSRHKLDRSWYCLRLLDGVTNEGLITSLICVLDDIAYRRKLSPYKLAGRGVWRLIVA